MLTEQMAALERRLGYTFRDKSLLAQALTHSSYGHAMGTPHSERLEFLGDSVLDLVSAEWLMAQYPDRREGFMSQRRAELVRKDTLAGHAVHLGIHHALRLGLKDDYLRLVNSVLADAFEALVGALYQDCGSIGTVRSYMLEWRVLK